MSASFASTNCKETKSKRRRQDGEFFVYLGDAGHADEVAAPLLVHEALGLTGVAGALDDDDGARFVARHAQFGGRLQEYLPGAVAKWRLHREVADALRMAFLAVVKRLGSTLSSV